MVISLILMALIASGGMALTYLFVDDEPLLWRFSAGAIVGSAIFGTILFTLGLFAGLSTGTVVAAILLTMSPLLLLRTKKYKSAFTKNCNSAKGKFRGATTAKFLRFGYYLFFVVLFLFFFERTLVESSVGILTGGSQNLGDLPFHLGAILGFADGNNFPPQNPSFAGAKFSYPFIADLVTAGFLKIQSDVKDAMLVQNVVWAFSLLGIVERFVFRLTKDKMAGKIAPALLFFSGGLGFIWFGADFLGQTKGILEFLWHLPKDYTISNDFRWGNALVALFMTQRSLLLGMPLTIVISGYLWKVFAETEEAGAAKSIAGFPISAIVAGLIAGLLPLVHLHSLVVLFVVTGFLFFLKLEKWRTFIAFGVGVVLTAVPMLIWTMVGTATRASEFISTHFGWDAGDANIIWFWFKNTGIVIPMVAVGIYYFYAAGRKSEQMSKNSTDSETFEPTAVLQFYLPFIFLFLIANVVIFAPWPWDNIKILIYAFVGSLPIISLLLATLWRKAVAFKVVASLVFCILIFSGGLDVWRTVSAQIKTRVFDEDAVRIAERIKAATPANSLILNAPTYNSAVVLTGRQSVMRYPGHLSSHGIDFADRQRDVNLIYSGGTETDGLLKKYGIDYVLISPEERSTLAPNEDYFRQFSVVAEAGQYKLYKVR